MNEQKQNGWWHAGQMNEQNGWWHAGQMNECEQNGWWYAGQMNERHLALIYQKIPGEGLSCLISIWKY